MVKPGQMPAHFQDQYRQGQHQPDPKPAGHVRKFCRGAIIQAHLLGLQSHTTDGAVPWPLLSNFRVHGARIHRTWRNRLLRLVFLTEVLLRVLVEFGLAARGAKVPGFTAMLAAMFRGVRIH